MFSPTEEKVLKILGKRRLSIRELSNRYFGYSEQVLNPNAVVSSAILRINRKCKYHKLKWFINGSGSGRGGKTVWRDK